MLVLDFCCPSDLSRIIIVSIRKRPSAHVAVEKGVASTSLLNLSNAHQPKARYDEKTNTLSALISIDGEGKVSIGEIKIED